MFASGVNEQHVWAAVTRNSRQAQEGLVEHTVGIAFADNDMLEENAIEYSRKARKAVFSHGFCLLLA